VTTSRSGARRWTRAGTALLTVAVALTAVTACSSGKVTQTSGQVAAIPGANADLGDISLRGVMVAYGGPEGYPIGGNAPLIVRIFNNGQTAVKLVGASASESATRVELTGAGGPPAEPTPDPSAEPDPSASPEPTPSPTPEPVAQAFAVEVKPASYQALVPGQGAYLQLVDLTEALTPGTSVRVTFRIDDGSTSHTVEMTVPVAPPETAVPRASADVPEPGHE
jgi:hypothetical protein